MRLVLLKGQSVLLKSFTEKDITQAYLDWLTDPVVTRYSNQRFKSHSRRTALDYLASFSRSHNYFFLISDIETGNPVGTITAYVSPQHCTADLGLMIGNRNFWGKGKGTDAWITLSDFLFQERHIRKLTAGTLRSNISMIRVLEKAGMHLEAVRVNQELIDQIPQDVLYYAKFRKT